MSQLKSAINAVGQTLTKSFLAVDKDRSGKISSSELRQIFSNKNITLTDGDLAEVVKRFDTNNDGVIDLKEFMAQISKPIQY